jgi:glycolate oxidase iron-sulfur subunit
MKANKTCKGIDEIAAVCSDCGNCLFSCPVYNAELVEPTSPRGKVNLIKSLRDGRLQPDRLNKKFLAQCALCGSCEHTCSKGVKFVEMMIDYRVSAARGKNIPAWKKMLLRFYHSFIFKKGIGVVDLLARTPLARKLFIPRRRKANLTGLMVKKPQQAHYDILFFPGCVLTYFYPEIISKTVGFLKIEGFSVVMPKGMECCGFPYLSQGWKERFESFRDRNRRLFSRFDFKYLVVPCGTGVMTFKNYYAFENQGIEILELTDFFYRHLTGAAVDTGQWAKDGGRGGRVTFHDPCHHLKSLGIEAAPRHFLKQLGDKFVDDKSALCCGFGGLFSVGFPSTSKKILKRKEERLEEMGADTVVTACPGCYLQLREHLSSPGTKGSKSRREVKFFIDLFET